MKPNATGGNYIFLSYAHKNNEQVQGLVKALLEEGYQVWFDINLELGERYNQTIAEQVKGCEIFVCFVTEQYGKSRYCDRELQLATKHGKTIVPVFIGNQAWIESSLPDGMLLAMADSDVICIGEPAEASDFLGYVRKNIVFDACKNFGNVAGDEEDAHCFSGVGMTVAMIMFATVILAIFLGNNLAKTRNTELLKLLRNAKLGDVVRMGSYEQDGDEGYGKEPIEWIVLDKQNGKALLLSRYVLDLLPFDENTGEATWQSCTLRRWLNGDFYENAFSNVDKAVILDSVIEAEENPRYKTEGGKNTTDKVFLLSIQEGMRYFQDDEERICPASQNAKFKIEAAYRNLYILELMEHPENMCCWWLRSPGRDLSSVAYIYLYGNIEDFGTGSDTEYIGVRPAIWVTLR